MARNAILITVDASTAAFDRAMASADKSLLRYSSQLKVAQRAQAEYDAAVAKSGASSTEAIAAQQRLGAALARTTVAEQRAAVEAKRAGEIQAQSAATAARAQEAASLKQAAALKKVGTVFGTLGTAAALGLGVAAHAAADFDTKMATLQSLTRGSAAEISKLAGAAHGYADLGFSASDAADAEIELVKAGISVNDIMGGALRGTVNLAAAGQLDLATATSIAAQAMTQFQLSGKDIPHVADLLAAGADKALGSVQDLGEGLQYSGLLAHQAGLSIDQTVGILSEFAQAGLIGAQGGTTLQQVLRQLLGPTAKAADEIKTLGLHLYDANGNFVGLASVAGQLHDKLGDMSQAQRNAALNTLFTSRAVRGATILYQDGAAGVDKWANRVEASGFAAQQASGKLNSLQGDVQKLEASGQNLLISFGQPLQANLRGVAQFLTKIADGLAGMSDTEKSVSLKTLELIAVFGTGAFALSRLTTALKVASASGGEFGTRLLVMKGGLFAAGIAAQAFASSISDAHSTTKAFLDIAGGAAAGAAFGPLGAALGAAGGAMQVYGSQSQEAAAEQAKLDGIAKTVTGTLNQQTGAITKATVAMTQKQLIDKGGVEAANALGVSFQTLTQAALGNRDAVASVHDAMTRFIYENGSGTDAIIKLGKALGEAGPLIDSLSANFDAAQKRILQFAIVSGQAHNKAVGLADVARQMGGAFLDFGEAAAQSGKDANTSADGNKKVSDSAHQATLALLGLASAQRDADAAFADSIGSVAALTLQIQSSREATKSLTGVMKANGNAINLQSVAGATLVQSLNGIASAALSVTGSQHTQALAVQHARAAIISQAEAAGASTRVANALADSLLIVANNANKIPPKKTVNVSAPGVTTVNYELERVLQSLNAMHDKTININYTHSGVQTGATGGLFVGGAFHHRYESGGPVRGPGTGTSDSINARLSNGEFVIKAKSVQQYGVGTMAAINAGRAMVVAKPLTAPPAFQSFAGGGLARGSDGLLGAVNGVRAEVAQLRARFDKPIDTNEQNFGGFDARSHFIAKSAIRQQTMLEQQTGGAGGG